MLATFSGATFSGATFSGATFYVVTFSGADEAVDMMADEMRHMQRLSRTLHPR